MIDNYPDPVTEDDIDPTPEPAECPNCGMTGRHSCESMSERRDFEAFENAV